MEMKPDAGEMVAGKLTAETLAQRIAPGEKALKNAEPIKVTEFAKGDRVLVTLEPDFAKHSPHRRHVGHRDRASER